MDSGHTILVSFRRLSTLGSKWQLDRYSAPGLERLPGDNCRVGSKGHFLVRLGSLDAIDVDRNTGPSGRIGASAIQEQLFVLEQERKGPERSIREDGMSGDWSFGAAGIALVCLPRPSGVSQVHRLKDGRSEHPFLGARVVEVYAGCLEPATAELDGFDQERPRASPEFALDVLPIRGRHLGFDVPLDPESCPTEPRKNTRQQVFVEHRVDRFPLR